MTEIDYWLDEYGLLHTAPNKNSENGILYTTEFHVAYMQTNDNGSYFTANEIMALINMHWNGQYFKQSPWDNRVASHDNMTALVVLNSFLNTPQLPFKIFPHYWHPRDIVYYSLMKGYWWVWPFIPILSIAMIMSCLRTYKKRPDIFEKVLHLIKHRTWIPTRVVHLHTDGKFLTWLRCCTNRFPITWWICRKILQHKYGKDWLYQISMIYFKHAKHPMRLITYGKHF